jgi:putative hydrolase of the HAD superfamily
MKRSAVLFDLGGVVLGSPLQAIREYERELGFSPNAINRVVATTAPGGAWSRLERGELPMAAFYDEFEADCRAAGLAIDARAMMRRMAGATAPRAIMLTAIARLRQAGLRTGALTNNWAHSRESTDPDAGEVASGTRGFDDGTGALRAHFDVFVESSVEGLRKPDPAIYRIACERLGVAPRQVVFLDDIGGNLKTARDLGMATIKVEDPRAALVALSEQVGLALLGES